MTSSRDPLGQQRGQADNDAAAKPDAGPELRWRRTLDLRKRPATLKVDGLLKDFGYLELSPATADAIQARLMRVGLQVEPSLHVAAAGDVITISRMVRGRGFVPRPSATATNRGSEGSVASQAAKSPGHSTSAPPTTDRDADLNAASLQLERLRTELEGRVRILESRLAARERELSDARVEAENLRVQLAELAATNSQSGVAAEAHLAAEQKAMLQGEPRELTELAKVLHDTRAALAATQHEIRQMVQDLADDVPVPHEEHVEPAPPPAAATELPDAGAPSVDHGVARTVFESAADDRPRRRGLPGRRR